MADDPGLLHCHYRILKSGVDMADEVDRMDEPLTKGWCLMDDNPIQEALGAILPRVPRDLRVHLAHHAMILDGRLSGYYYASVYKGEDDVVLHHETHKTLSECVVAIEAAIKAKEANHV